MSEGLWSLNVNIMLHTPAGLPVFTGPIYGWKGSQNGVLLGVLGIASLPVSFLVGYISPHVSDRALTLAAVIVTGLGAAMCTQAGLRRRAAAYFGGGGMLYLVGSPYWPPDQPGEAGRLATWSSPARQLVMGSHAAQQCCAACPCAHSYAV